MIFNLQRIKRTIKKNHIKSITIDVFDTLLMRKIYPEDIQFLLHAQEAVKILESIFDRQISPYYFYSLRKFARSINDDLKQDQKYDRESHIEEIFGIILNCLNQKYQLDISETQQAALIERLIKKELEIETRYLKPNKGLIKTLRKYKSHGIPIYFISDIYLDSDHLQHLFQHFKMNDLFAGGLCSSEIGYCKGTGKLFKQIKKKKLFSEINFLSNLHIGDNPISDYLSPRQHGSLAHKFKTLHHRPWRPLKVILGTILLRFKLYFHHRHIRQEIKKQIKNNTQKLSSHQKELYQIGQTLAPALLYYLSYLDISSQQSQTPIFFLSREGETLSHLLRKLHSSSSIKILETFNRINTLRCFAYLSLTKPQIKYSQAIVHLFFHGEGKRTLSDLLKSMGIKKQDLGLTDIALNHMPAEKFVNKLIKLMRKKKHHHLQGTYSQMLHELSNSGLFQQKRVILADVGWNGTIQILLEQIMQLLGKKIKTRGIYLGATGQNIFGLKKRKNIQGIIYKDINDPLFAKMLVEEIWEFVLTGNKTKNEKLHWIQKGIEDYFDLYNEKLEYSPDRLFRLGLKKLFQLFYKPSKKQIILLGSVEHDTGFGLDKTRPLVDLNHSKLKLYKMIATNPKAFKQLYLKQYWERGFLHWYKLQIFQPVINAIRWLRKKNLEIFG